MKRYIKTFIIISLFSLLSEISTGQVITFEEAQKEVFSNLNLKEITTGILYNAGLLSNRLTYFDGKNTDSTANWNNWRQSYTQIYTAHLTEPKISDFEKATEQIENYKELNKNIIPIGIISFMYNIIKDNALEDKLILFDNDKLSDTYNNETPYRLDTFFTASPLTNSFFSKTGEVIYNINKQFYYSNFKETIQKIEINFDDGMGFREVFFDENIYISYSYLGIKKIKTRLHFQNIILSCNSEIEFYNSSSSPEEPKTGDLGDWKVPDIIIDEINGQTQEYYIGIWYACQNHQILKPAIFIEGFDPTNSKKLDVEKDKNNLWAVTTTSSYILERLQDEGYDIFIVDFKENNIDLRESAIMVVEIINYINSIKASDCELIIGGRSGGGLLARYALAYMEGLNMSHETKLLLTLDSEHQGANISLGFQHFLYDFLVHPNIVSILGLFGAQFLNTTLNSDYARQILYYHYTATDEDNNKAYPTNMHTQFYNQLKNLNNGYGYPTKVKKIATSNAGKTGQRQGVNYSQLFNELHFPVNTQCQGFKIESKIYALPDYNNSGQILKTSLKIRFLIIGCIFTPWITLYSKNISINNVKPYDDANGSYLAWHSGAGKIEWLNYLPDIYVAPVHECFVPISSALDLDNNVLPSEHGGVYCSVINDILPNPNIVSLSNNIYMNLQPFEITPFDIFLVDDSNHEHITSNSNWSLLFENQVFPENIFLQNREINYDQNFYAENNIYAGNNVTISVPQGNFIVKSNKKVVFTAGNEIVLEPGFETEDGAEFTAEIIENPTCNKKIRKNTDKINTITPYNNEEYNTSNNNIFNLIKESEKPISIYPNPSKGNFIVSFNFLQETPVKIDVYNYQGRNVYSVVKNNRTNNLNLTNQKSGIYFLKLTVNNQYYTVKIIIQK